MMNCVLIVTNFNAGRKKAIKYKKRVINFVLKHTKSFKFVDIDGLKDLDITPYDTVLAMGGDGTVNKVLPYLINTEKVLGIIPCGTANLLAAKLGLSSYLNKTLKIINNKTVKSIDLLDINGNLSSLRCGFGYDSDIICKTPQSLKNKFGYFAYFIAGILFALRLKNKEYKIKFDDKECLKNASCIIISNAANMYKNIVSIASESKLDDGYMDIFILKTMNPITFFLEFILLILNIRCNSNRAEYHRAKSISIEIPCINCHIDGEKRILKDNVIVKIHSKSLKIFAK